MAPRFPCEKHEKHAQKMREKARVRNLTQTRRGRVYLELTKGPMAVREIAALLSVSPYLLRHDIHILCQRGLARRIGQTTIERETRALYAAIQS